VNDVGESITASALELLLLLLGVVAVAAEGFVVVVVMGFVGFSARGCIAIEGESGMREWEKGVGTVAEKKAWTHQTVFYA
jgi:hypothetical protein